MGKIPYIKWYAQDALVDVMGWPENHVGAWARMCWWWWANGPTKPEVIMTISPSVAEVLETYPDKIITFEDGTISSKRLEMERDAALKTKRANVERARKAAETRWKEQNDDDNAPSMLEASTEHAPSTGQASDSNAKTMPPASEYELESESASEQLTPAPENGSEKKQESIPAQIQTDTSRSFKVYIDQEGLKPVPNGAWHWLGDEEEVLIERIGIQRKLTRDQASHRLFQFFLKRESHENEYKHKKAALASLTYFLNTWEKNEKHWEAVGRKKGRPSTKMQTARDTIQKVIQ
jgi:hypothetical protein